MPPALVNVGGVVFGCAVMAGIGESYGPIGADYAFIGLVLG